MISWFFALPSVPLSHQWDLSLPTGVKWWWPPVFEEIFNCIRISINMFLYSVQLHTHFIGLWSAHKVKSVFFFCSFTDLTHSLLNVCLLHCPATQWGSPQDVSPSLSVSPLPSRTVRLLDIHGDSSSTQCGRKASSSWVLSPPTHPISKKTLWGTRQDLIHTLHPFFILLPHICLPLSASLVGD